MMGEHASPAVVPELLALPQAAAICGMAARTFHRHARDGKAPRPVRIGGTVRWRRGELIEWIAAGCPRVDGRAAR